MPMQTVTARLYKNGATSSANIRATMVVDNNATARINEILLNTFNMIPKFKT